MGLGPPSHAGRRGRALPSHLFSGLPGMRATFWFNESIFSSASVERSSGSGGDLGLNSIPTPHPHPPRRAPGKVRLLETERSVVGGQVFSERDGKGCTRQTLEHQTGKARTCSVGKEAEQCLKLVLLLLNSSMHPNIQIPLRILLNLSRPGRNIPSGLLPGE